MAKTISAALEAHHALEVTSLATLWKVKRTDGVIFGFTDHDASLKFDLGDGDGEITYKAETGYTRTAVSGKIGMAPDNLEVEGVLSSSTITDTDIRAGKWDDAEIKMFSVNWDDLTMGELKIRFGHLGDVEIQNKEHRTKLRGIMQRYSQEIGEIYIAECRVDLGSVECKVKLVPDDWTASTVVTVRPPRDAGLGTVFKPTTQNKFHYKNSVAGTTGLTEPIFNTVIGGTTDETAKATGTILFNSNPLNNDTITLNGSTWTFVTGAPTGNQTQIGVDLATTLTSLVSDLNGSADTSIDDATYGQSGGNTLTITHDTDGEVGNSFGLAASGDATPSGATLTGGSLVQWITIQALSQTGTVDTVTDRRNFVALAGVDIAVDYWNEGTLKWLIGSLAGITQEVKDDDGAGGIQLKLPAGLTILPGDTFRLTTGCDKSRAACRDKFDNIFNARAEYDIPGRDFRTAVPGART